MVNPYKINNKVEYISKRRSAFVTVIAYVIHDGYHDIREVLMDIFRRLAKESKYARSVSFGIVDIVQQSDLGDLIKFRFSAEELPKIVIYRSGGSSVFEVDKIDYQKIKIAIDLALIH